MDMVDELIKKLREELAKEPEMDLLGFWEPSMEEEQEIQDIIDGI